MEKLARIVHIIWYDPVGSNVIAGFLLVMLSADRGIDFLQNYPILQYAFYCILGMYIVKYLYKFMVCLFGAVNKINVESEMDKYFQQTEYDIGGVKLSIRWIRDYKHKEYSALH